MNEETRKYIDEKVEEFKRNLIKEIECKQEQEDKFPKIGDDYWFLADDGVVERDCWENCINDNYRLEIGNISPTEEEMEFKRERLKVIAELEKYAEKDRKWDGVWDGVNEHYYFVWDYDVNKIAYCFNTVLKGTDIYFESAEKAREAVRVVGEDRVKKYYLRVEE